MNDLRCLLFRMNTPSLGALTSTIGMSGFHKNSVSVQPVETAARHYSGVHLEPSCVACLLQRLGQ